MSKEKMTALQQLVEETLPTLLPEKEYLQSYWQPAVCWRWRPAPLLAASWMMPL